MVRIREIEEGFSKLERSVNKCGKDALRNISEVKSIYWTFYSRNLIGQNDLVDYDDRVNSHIQAFEDDCRCKSRNQ